jgi:hypothetical protein
MVVGAWKRWLRRSIRSGTTRTRGTTSRVFDRLRRFAPVSVGFEGSRRSRGTGAYEGSSPRYLAMRVVGVRSRARVSSRLTGCCREVADATG